MENEEVRKYNSSNHTLKNLDTENNFMLDIKKILEENGPMGKFEGVAPDGFILVHEKTLADLKDFDIWKDWKNDSISIKELNKKNFDNN